MLGNRGRDTKPERQLRCILHQSGLRYRVGPLLRVGDRKVRPDVVFFKSKVAVFVDGCFWHGCPEHGRLPRRNAKYWQAKLARNVDRDRRTDVVLLAEGWTVVRVWEHEDPAVAAQRVRAALGYSAARG